MSEQFGSGDWLVEEGQEQEFIARWRVFTSWAKDNMPGAHSFTLLQDVYNPAHFVSFGTWDDLASVTRWKETPEFAQMMARCRELCKEFHGSDYNVATVV